MTPRRRRSRLLASLLLVASSAFACVPRGNGSRESNLSAHDSAEGRGSNFHRPGHEAREAAEREARAIHWTAFCDAEAKGHCGLITAEVFDRAYLSDFAERECAELAEPVLSNCAARVHRHFVSRVMKRYARLEHGALQGICEKIPLRCSNPVVLELIALEAHNFSLERFPDAEFDIHSAEDAARMRARVRAVVAGVVPWIYERLSECGDGVRDCACPEGLLADRSCGEALGPKAAEPDAGDSDTEWL